MIARDGSGPSLTSLPGAVALSIVLLLALTTLLTGCGLSDFSRERLSVEKGDHGWLLAVEPDEEFSVDLLGSNAYPDARWAVVEFDPAVLSAQGSEFEPPRFPQVAEDPGESRVDATFSHFTFVGAGPGSTALRFELLADDARIDIARYTVEVVDDSCAAATAAVANRCGGDGFTYMPQILSADRYAERFPMAPDTTTAVRLAATALHPDARWRVEAYDDAVVSVSEPVALGPAREEGDYGPVEWVVSHTFLPEWEVVITGVAPGESIVRMSLEADGVLLDTFMVTIVVEPEAS
ncbi:hypothetical protein [Demequina lignilytica]|uniref:Immunoglobulin-like domain of spore germination n=1 Tax=Demequina lignilytica TaxID=3051663 RepID=A0AB35MDU1_9MICO|nr:hypothetical protein [Demequina sp. SYSU T0a273]MDN4481928.1 hypothetical protein [Demequina sp. SYSU T0a273]